MKYLVTVALLLVFFNGGIGQDTAGSPWTWLCQNKVCLRNSAPTSGVQVPMEVCKLNCADLGSLLPVPTGTVTIGKAITALVPAKIIYSGYEEYPEDFVTRLGKATDIFKGYLLKMHPDYNGIDDPFPTTGPITENSLNITFDITDKADLTIRLNTDESYDLQISLDADNKGMKARIQARTYFGARHGLETLSQLIAYDDIANALQVVNTVSITDAPVYPYRGMHLDTSRNYFSVESIKKVIDGMSFNKLNMFHWHITDTHSFPMEVDGRPEMTRYGAYSPRQIYSKADMQGIVEYARIRGVKVVAEFDEPAHTGNGWQWGPDQGLGELVVCNDKQPWYDFCVEPPCGQLNIVNDNMYDVLGEVFKSMLSVFDNDLFHMGGDEVDFRCYNTTPLITDWMTENNYTRDQQGFLDLWGRFQDKAHAMLLNGSRDQGLQSILWTSHLTEDGSLQKYLNPEDYIIQIWTAVDDPMIGTILNNGYKAIFTNYDVLYLDCGFQQWIGDGHNWCSPYHEWQVIYENSPFKIYENLTNTTAADSAFRNGQLIGSETALWTEQADELSVEGRLWPRGSAHAERLWTNPTTTWAEAEARMVTNRQRFVQRGLKPDRLKPQYCSQNEDKCYGYPKDVEGTTTTPPPETSTSTTSIPTVSTSLTNPSTQITPTTTPGTTTAKVVDNNAGNTLMSGVGSLTVLLISTFITWFL